MAGFGRITERLTVDSHKTLCIVIELNEEELQVAYFEGDVCKFDTNSWKMRLWID